jgi:hypothetical protein
MAADRASPKQPHPPKDDAGDGQPAKTRPAERYGVVEVARHTKDDGRALLLYTRIGDRAT